jgi:hypothetical protein
MKCIAYVLFPLLWIATVEAETPEYPDLTILYTARQRGYLEPCGCTDGQLGGIPRSGGFIESLRKEGQNILLYVIA